MMIFLPIVERYNVSAHMFVWLHATVDDRSSSINRGGRFEFSGRSRDRRASGDATTGAVLDGTAPVVVHSLIARIGSRTASALFSSAARSSAVSSTSITFSRPLRAELARHAEEEILHAVLALRATRRTAGCDADR